jgi:hypothetical protein
VVQAVPETHQETQQETAEVEHISVVVAELTAMLIN